MYGIFFSGTLEAITTSMISSLDFSNKGGEIKMLKVITDPFIKLVVQESVKENMSNEGSNAKWLVVKNNKCQAVI